MRQNKSPQEALDSSHCLVEFPGLQKGTCVQDRYVSELHTLQAEGVWAGTDLRDGQRM